MMHVTGVQEGSLSLLGQMSGRALQRTWTWVRSQKNGEVNRTGKTLRKEELDEEREWTRDVMRGDKTRQSCRKLV